MKESGELLFILGAPKTCTSSLLSMLNCHPDIFIMSEAFMEKVPKICGNKICSHFKKHPNDIIHKGVPLDLGYARAKKMVESRGKKYVYFGDKWARLQKPKRMNGWFKEFGENKVIFTVRDIRTWLSHNTVKNMQSLDDPNVIMSKAIRYVYLFLKALTLPNVICVTLDEFVSDNDATIDKLDAWLPNVSLRPHVENWWEKTGSYEDSNKMIYKWWTPGPRRKRESSFIKPEKQDIAVQIKNNYMWDAILPIFDKYYRDCNGIFNPAEITNDLNKLLQIEIKPIQLEDCFKTIDMIKLGAIKEE